MGHVPFIDASGVHAIKEVHKECGVRKIRLVLVETQAAVLGTMEKMGVLEKIGKKNIYDSMSEAVKSI